MLKFRIINISALPILLALSLITGVAGLSWAGSHEAIESLRLLAVSRLPRTLAVALAGGALSIAGMVMQIALRNHFVEPGMVGASQSAALGALLITLMFPGASFFLKTGFATLCAVGGMAVFLLMLRGLSSEKVLLVPLAGVIFGGLIEAVTTFIAYRTDTLQLMAVMLAGDFSGMVRGRYEWLWACLIPVGLAFLNADKLTITGLGRDACVGLGINYDLMVWTALFLGALVGALVVVTVGHVPFVGLVVPNIVARFAGENLKRNLPMVGLVGMNLLLACDLLGRVLNRPYEVPVSTIFGVLGAGIFLHLLFRRRAAHGF